MTELGLMSRRKKFILMGVLACLGVLVLGLCIILPPVIKSGSFDEQYKAAYQKCADNPYIVTFDDFPFHDTYHPSLENAHYFAARKITGFACSEKEAKQLVHRDEVIGNIIMIFVLGLIAFFAFVAPLQLVILMLFFVYRHFNKRKSHKSNGL